MKFIELPVSDFLNMTKEEFDKAFEEDSSNSGELSSIVNYLRYQYEIVMVNINGLKQKAMSTPNGKDDPEIIATLQSLYGFANRFEYMTFRLLQKLEDLNKGVSESSQ